MAPRVSGRVDVAIGGARRARLVSGPGDLRRAAPEMALAVGIFVAALLQYHRCVGAQVVAAAAVLALPLVVRLEWPLASTLAAAGGLIWLSHAPAVPSSGFPTVEVIALGFALWAVGSRRPAAPMTAAWLLASGAWVATVGVSAPAAHLAAGPPLFAVALLVGRATGVLRLETDSHAEVTARLVRERDERAAVAVGEERRRIARELHDVVAHSVSVMGVQAGAVRTVLHPEQTREAEALLQVEQAGRDAIAELKRLLGLLRDDDDAPEMPALALRRVDRLVADVRDAGLSVELSTSGDLSGLPAGLDVTAYRIVQEALTNVLKHAPGAATAVDVTRTAETLRVSVVDRGADDGAAQPTAPGHGLLGIRERAALYGGTVHLGPSPGGGFQVIAVFPLGLA